MAGHITVHGKTRTTDGGEAWHERRSEPGVVYARSVVAQPWVELERTDCYCCSCSDVGMSDPHCRNHGFDGRRPCEEHNMPGLMDCGGVMPDSVQRKRARNKEGRDGH